METSKKQNSTNDTHLSSSWEIWDRKMNKSEFTNVKKLQDPFPRFCCFREELRLRNTKKSPHGMAICVCTCVFPWKVIWGTRGFTRELLFLQIFLRFPKQRWTTSTDPIPNYTSAALQTETKKITKKKRRQKSNIKYFLSGFKAKLSLDHGLRPVLE